MRNRGATDGDEAITAAALLARSPARRGVAGAVLCLVCLCVVSVLATPPFLPVDESAHGDYVMQVGDGRLPTVRETVEPQIDGQHGTRQFTGNHPPLYYALAAPLLRTAVDADRDVLGVRLTRGLSVLFAAATVVLVALVAGSLVTHRRVETMVLAAAVAATLPTFVSVSRVIQNDTLALLASTAVILGAVTIVRDGPRARPVALVCVGSAVALATRFSSVGVVALAVAAVGVAALRHGHGSALRRAGRAVGTVALPVVCVLATSGWFYQRNRRIYGDITGVEFKAQRSDRRPVASFWEYGLSPRRVLDGILRSEGGGGLSNPMYFGRRDAELLVVAGVVVAVGVALLAWRWVRERRERRDAGAHGRSPLDGLLLAGLVVGVPVVAWGQLAAYVAQSGGNAARYTFVALPVVATLVAAACLAYPGRLGIGIGAAVVSLQALLALTTAARYLDGRSPDLDDGRPFHLLADAFELGDVAAAGVVLALLLAGVALGIGLQVSAMLAAGRRATPGGAGETLAPDLTPQAEHRREPEQAPAPQALDG